MADDDERDDGNPGHPGGDNPSDPEADAGPLIQLLRRAQGGDAAAREALFARLRQDLLPRIRRQLSGRQPQGGTGNDVVNEASLRIFQKLLTITASTEAELRAFVFNTAENYLRDLFRASQRYKRRQDAETTLSSQQPQREGARDTDLVDAMDRGKRWRQLLAILPRLEPDQRHALFLKLRGASMAEMGAALLRSPAAAANVLCRAIKRAQRELQRLEDAATDEGVDPRLSAAFLRYLELLDRDDAPPREDFLAAHPDLAAPLAELLDDLDEILALLRESQDSEG